MSLVLDASVALAWCFPDEQDAQSHAWLDLVGENGAVVPQIWPLEVLNGLATAVRRGRITAEDRRRLSDFLRDLPIRIDGETAARAWADTGALAEVHRLTPYDAAYLELALRLGLPLATVDNRLAEAAKKAGVR